MPKRVQAVDQSAALFDQDQPGAAPLARTALAGIVVAAHRRRRGLPVERAKAGGARPHAAARRRVAAIPLGPGGHGHGGPHAGGAGRLLLALRTLGRSVPHRAALSVASAFGLAVATIGFGRAVRAPVSQPGGARDPLDADDVPRQPARRLLDQAIRLPAHLPSGLEPQARLARRRPRLRGRREARPGRGHRHASTSAPAGRPAVVPPPRSRSRTSPSACLLLLVAIEARFISPSTRFPFLAYVAGSRVKVPPIWLGAAVFVLPDPVEDRSHPGGGRGRNRSPRGALSDLGRAHLDRTPQGRARGRRIWTCSRRSSTKRPS